MANNNENPNGIFRKKSIERISSPEELHDYVKVANPGVWMLLIAIVALLVGFCVWAILGELETTVPAVINSENKHTDCYIKDENTTKISVGMYVRIDGVNYKIVAISGEPIDAQHALTEYSMHLGELEQGEWVRAVSIEGNPPDGSYSAEIITETINPIKFIFS